MMPTPLFPRRRPRPDGNQYIDYYCHFDDVLKKHLVCSEFFFAKTAGEIIPDHNLGCWVLVNDVKRSMDWKAKYYSRERGQPEVDHTDEKYQRWDCPWCSGEAEPIPLRRIDCE